MGFLKNFFGRQDEPAERIENLGEREVSKRLPRGRTRNYTRRAMSSEKNTKLTEC